MAHHGLRDSDSDDEVPLADAFKLPKDMAQCGGSMFKLGKVAKVLRHKAVELGRMFEYTHVGTVNRTVLETITIAHLPHGRRRAADLHDFLMG